ncbi:hypothetical protein C1646_749588 [Rhizophagus diaphanus]|nr:hypothetical protein C1646_749588 [Rhizophagus diaphanus] [Rhizophagus sp. MUCL 43196]
MAMDLWNGVSASTTTAFLYLANSAHSILAFIRCKVFKLIQDRDKFTGNWKRYYISNLKQRIHHQKVKQNDDFKVSQRSTNTMRLSKKYKKTKQIKKIDKDLDSVNKLTV